MTKSISFFSFKLFLSCENLLPFGSVSTDRVAVPQELADARKATEEAIAKETAAANAMREAEATAGKMT